MISFFIIYVWLANALAFRILRGRNYESLGTKVILLYAALLMGAVFVHAGNIWCDTMEAIRLGNGHGSYRDRVPWDHHAAAEYVVGILVFCGAAVIQRRTAALESSSQRLPTEQV